MMHLVAHEAPGAHHEGDAPSVGAYGLEGSKPGAAAAGVELSHATIPHDRSGYGVLLGRCIFNAKHFYIGVNTLAEPDDNFFTVPVARLPAERPDAPPEEIEAEGELMKSRLRVVSNEELLSRLIDVTLAKPFKEIGPDLTVFAYAFNLIGEDGKANADSSGMDKLNKTVFDLLSIGQAAEGNAAQKVPMVITSTQMQPKVYGDEFTDEFCRRAGITRQNSPIRVLISTIQEPCVSDTATGNFIPELVKILRQTVLDARATILKGDG